MEFDNIILPVRVGVVHIVYVVGLGQQMTHVIMKVWYSIISEAARNQRHTSSCGRSNNESRYHNNQQVYEYDICMF